MLLEGINRLSYTSFLFHVTFFFRLDKPPALTPRPFTNSKTPCFLRIGVGRTAARHSRHAQHASTMECTEVWEKNVNELLVFRLTPGKKTPQSPGITSLPLPRYLSCSTFSVVYLSLTLTSNSRTGAVPLLQIQYTWNSNVMPEPNSRRVTFVCSVCFVCYLCV
jgi:hypothetical protein